MPKFNFKLQPMLNLKMQLEDQLKNELGKATQKLEFEKNRLSHIENEREEQINRINTESSQGITIEKLKEYGVYISYLKARIEAQKENVNYAHKIVDKYREELIKAVQERDMLEKLKEKKFQEYMLEMNREEQKLNDEIISYNFNKNSLGDSNG